MANVSLIGNNPHLGNPVFGGPPPTVPNAIASSNNPTGTNVGSKGGNPMDVLKMLAMIKSLQAKSGSNLGDTIS